MIPGEIVTGDKEIELNLGKATLCLDVANSGDRPIQVGSHYPFSQVNKALIFEREKTKGMRLNIPAGTAIRFEPGDCKEVELVLMGGMINIISNE